MDMDELLNPVVLGVTAVFTILMLFFLWKMGAWDRVAFRTKLIISLVCPFAFYGVAYWRVNKGG